MSGSRNVQEATGKQGLFVAAVVVAAVVVAVVVVFRTDTTGESGSGLTKSFHYDRNTSRKTDPNLITHSETGKIELKLEEPRGVAVSKADTVFVAGDDVVARFDKDGTPLPDLRVGGEAFCVAVGADGAVYVGLRDHVRVFDAAGEQKASWDSRGERAFLTGIAVADEDVFVADSGNRVVLHYKISGQFEKEIGSFNLPSPHLDVTVGEQGLLWVNNPGKLRLEGYTFRGDLERTWGEHSSKIQDFCGCCNPTSVALLPDGRFVTSEKGIARVKTYSSDGKFEGVVAGVELFTRKTEGLDLAVDSQSRILVLDPVAKAVRIFAPKPKDGA
jgi:hypothetical protein